MIIFFFDTYKNLSAKYYQVNKERLQKKAHVRDHNLSKEKKERYKNLSVDEKRKLVKYRKKNYRLRKNALL